MWLKQSPRMTSQSVSVLTEQTCTYVLAVYHTVHARPDTITFKIRKCDHTMLALLCCGTVKGALSPIFKITIKSKKEILQSEKNPNTGSVLLEISLPVL